jgi:hypothetical protein
MSPSASKPSAQARLCALALGLLIACAFCPAAFAGTYGSAPLNIAVGVGNSAPDGASGEPAVSGDNRMVRLVAFSSQASNLIRRDGNAVSDVFVWYRPAGALPRTPGRGRLERASVTNSGREANGPSGAPSLDGSLTRRPHCVAFQSRATNLSPGDALPDSDIYVRDLRRRRTVLVSRGVAADATNPSLAGDCRRIVFAAGGSVWWARVGGNPHRIARGGQPSYSRDGASIAYVDARGRVVFRHRGLRRVLARGSNPRVSDHSPIGGWAVAFNAGGNVRLGLIDGGRKHVQTAVRDAFVGGITAKAAGRGIVVWARRSALYYLNRHTGNSDDLAYASHPITEIAASARANLIAFTAAGGAGFIDTRGNRQPGVYVKWLPK